MDAVVDAIIALLADFKTLGPAGKVGFLAAMVALISAAGTFVHRRTRAKLREHLLRHDELVAEIDERKQLIEELKGELDSLQRSHPDQLVKDIEREERDENEDRAIRKSDILFGNLQHPMIKACRLLAHHHLSGAAGADWQRELAVADRYVTIGHALDPLDKVLHLIPGKAMPRQVRRARKTIYCP